MPSGAILNNVYKYNNKKTINRKIKKKKGKETKKTINKTK